MPNPYTDAAYYISGYLGASANASNNSTYQTWARQQVELSNNYLESYGLPHNQIVNRTLDLSPNGFYERMVGTPNYLQFQPFGNLAVPNYGGGGAGFFSPFAPQSYNNYAALSEPFSFNPQYIDLSKPQNVVGTLPPPSPEELSPDLNTPLTTEGALSYLVDFSTWFNSIMIQVGVLLLALLLVGVGLYFLAKATDEGQLAIGAAKKALV